jgi:uncharacterized protein YifE (UPF0438 family)
MRYRALEQLKKDERESIYSFVKKLERLDRGEIYPKGEKQHRFCRVCQGAESPLLIYEFAYIKYRSFLIEATYRTNQKSDKPQPKNQTEQIGQPSTTRPKIPEACRDPSTNKKSLNSPDSTGNLGSERPRWMRQKSVENARKIKQHDEKHGGDNSERLPRPGFSPLNKFQ